jgi:hypothetical protein
MAAGIPWLRPYDLRHTAITRLAEAGTPTQVIMSMAGHVTLRMQQHYTAVSLMSRRGWVNAAWGDSFPQADPNGNAKGVAAAHSGPVLMGSPHSAPLPWETVRQARMG